VAQQELDGDSDAELGRDDEDGNTLIPRSVPGHIFVRSGVQVFAKTGTILAMGMCGGPVLDEQGYCVGLVEGVVPVAPASAGEQQPASEQGNGSGVSDKARSLLAGCAVFVELPELHKLHLEVSTRNKRGMR
jgi:hypothetical protein